MATVLCTVAVTRTGLVVCNGLPVVVAMVMCNGLARPVAVLMCMAVVVPAALYMVMVMPLSRFGAVQVIVAVRSTVHVRVAISAGESALGVAVSVQQVESAPAETIALVAHSDTARSPAGNSRTAVTPR
ncbi:hypothetical protein [Nocardia sp. NBC_01009]|uniref:hypothetical protein n=1 Tax=Nocardia sp. NBC_01009 TaxID=2975996 RepID=UPI003869985B|nr:hypothetical protein OHA42_09225 [Nocardia sp. NBC_01009]